MGLQKSLKTFCCPFIPLLAHRRVGWGALGWLVMGPREGRLGWKREREWAAPAKVWRGGDCKGGNCADKQRGPEKIREKLRKKCGRAGTPPSLFSLIFFIPSLPLGSPSFLSHFSWLYHLSLSELKKAFDHSRTHITSGDGGDKTCCPTL